MLAPTLKVGGLEPMSFVALRRHSRRAEEPGAEVPSEQRKLGSLRREEKGRENC